MLSYCLKSRKTQKKPNTKSTKNGRIMLLLKSVGNKQWKFIKEQKASGLLSSLVIKTPFKKIPLMVPLFF